MTTREQIRNDLEEIILSSFSIVKNSLNPEKCPLTTQSILNVLNIASESLSMIGKIGINEVLFSDEIEKESP